MNPSTTPPSEAELVARVRVWINLVADGELAMAAQQLDASNSYGMSWTPDTIAEAIAAAYPPGCRFRPEHPEGPMVSKVESVPGDGRPSVVEFGDGSGYSVEHGLQLNGQYSDLTVQMEFRWQGAHYGGGKRFSMTLHGVTYDAAHDDLLFSARPEGQIKRVHRESRQLTDIMGLPVGTKICDVDLWGVRRHGEFSSGLDGGRHQLLRGGQQ